MEQAIPTGLRFLPPAWLLNARDGRIDAYDAAGARSVRAEGAAASSLAALARLAAPGDAIRDLADALARETPVPATLGGILRGPGFSTLFVELTARCNERCVHCYADSGPERGEALSREEVFAALDDARGLDFRAIQFTGGDPLLCPFLPEAAERAVALGFEKVEIYTNGLALEGPLRDRLLGLPLSWSFSVYSDSPVRHDAVTRVPGSHARTIAALRSARDAGAPARVGAIELAADPDALARTLAFLRGLGLPDAAIHVSRTRAVGRGRDVPDDDAPQGAASGSPYASPAEAEESHGADDFDSPFSGRAALSFDGEVLPCILARTFSFGNVRRRSLRDILTDATPIALDPEFDFAEGFDAPALRATLTCRACRVRSALTRDAARRANPAGGEPT